MDSGTSFNVVVVQFNGGLQRQKVVSVLRVSAAGVALHGVDGSVRCEAAYHNQMQVPCQEHLLGHIWRLCDAARGLYYIYLLIVRHCCRYAELVVEATARPKDCSSPSSAGMHTCW